jgi:hypothetical protein
MPGIKIINVLKDDTFPEILELFRQAPAGEVIFVLPKSGKVFRREDHFAAFASEAATGDKKISILCSAAPVNALARKYKFTVMSASKEAKLATAPLSADDDIQDYNEDAYQDDVVVGGGEQDNIRGQDTTTDEDEVPPGMHVEDADGTVEAPKDIEADLVSSPIHAELAASVDGVRVVRGSKSVPVKGRAEKPAPIKVERPAEELDYIDAMWREKASQLAPQTAMAPARRVRATSRWASLSGSGVSKKVAASILAASFILLATIVYATTGSATVTLVPVAKPVNTQIAVQASDVFSAVDTNFGKIPGQLFQVTKTAIQEATATGKRDVASKSRGKITIYNEFSSTPQPLVATTRFISSGGLIFRTLQTVSVPGSTVKNGAPVPGSIIVDVIADKPGSQYDIEADTFKVAAFVEKGDNDRAAKIYGKSSEKFSGGANGPSSVVTQADYDKAKEAAIASVKTQIKEAFAAQSSGMTILEGTEPQIGEVQSTAKPDDAAATFRVTATATLKTIAFRPVDLQQLIKSTVAKKDRLDVFPDKLTLTYANSTFKPDLGTLSFTVTAKGNGYTPVDQNMIVADIKGKDAQGFRDYFKDKEGIESATVSLSPFWVRSLPSKPERIKLQLDYAGK